MSTDHDRNFSAMTPAYVISTAAELSGMHPQTLRQYDRLGLVTPHRADGGGRRYSARDIERLREVQRLSQDEGVNLAGIKHIRALQDEVAALQTRVAELEAALAILAAPTKLPTPVEHESIRTRAHSQFLPARPVSTSLIVWRPTR
jgi:MerR family transcriptional regulator/heat shock protein HspR